MAPGVSPFPPGSMSSSCFFVSAIAPVHIFSLFARETASQNVSSQVFQSFIQKRSRPRAPLQRKSTLFQEVSYFSRPQRCAVFIVKRSRFRKWGTFRPCLVEKIDGLVEADNRRLKPVVPSPALSPAVRPQNRIQHLIQSFAKVLTKEAQHKIPMFLQRGVLASIAPISLGII